MTRVYAGGVWDIFHYGHLQLLRQARLLAGRDGEVIVGVISDAGAKRLPIIPFYQREAIVLNLACVDEVVEQPTHDSMEILQGLPRLPDYLVHGSDAEPLAAAWFRSQGGEVVLFPYTEGVSTTCLRALIAKAGTKT